MPRVFFPEQLVTRYIKLSESLTALGANAHSSKAAVNSIALGAGSLENASGGNMNVAVGNGAMRMITTASYNVAVGNTTMQDSTTAAYNVAVGYGALRSVTSGSSNIGVGAFALFSTTWSGWNVVVGTNAMSGNVTGGANVALGYNALRYLADGSTLATALANCVGVGENTRAAASTNANSIVIGSQATGLGSNSVVLGNGAITLTVLRGRVGCGTTAPAADARVHLHDGHLVHSQTTEPTAAATANAGVGASASLSNATDLRGVLTLTTGTASWAAGAQVTVTFNQAYVTAPIVALTPANANAATQAVARGVYVSATTTSFSVNFAVADTAQRTYVWYYIVVG